MRQGQQNRRGRGRSNNRKGQGSLSRSFESNGPDVKIRGTAAHVAEKYISLARDAQSSGDIVMAENYLQHAEHYNRIIMTVREQANTSEAMNGAAAGPRGRNHFTEQPAQADNDETDSGEQSPAAATPAREVATAREVAPAREPRNSEQRTSEPRRRTPRRTDRTAAAAAERAPGTEAQPSAHESFTTGDEPEFLKRPVRRKPRANGDDATDATAAKTASENAGASED